MKPILWLALGLVLLAFAGSSQAVCVDPLIAYHSCLEACPDPLQDTLGASNCSNTCIGQWQTDNDAFNRCQREEEEARQAEQKRLEEEQRAKELAEQDQNLARVLNSKGKVEVRQPDGSWKALAPGQTLKDGDTVRTGNKSKALVGLPDGGQAILGPNSMYTYRERKIMDKDLTKITHHDITLELLVGRLRAWVKKSRAKFEVRTPPAVVAVRGTDFVVEHDADTNTTKVYLYEGELDVNNNLGYTFPLTAGGTLIVDKSGAFGKLPLTEEEWQGLLASIEVSEEALPEEETAVTFPEEWLAGTEDLAQAGLAAVAVVLMAGVLIGLVVFYLRKKSGPQKKK